jgi:hypothetical protein
MFKAVATPGDSLQATFGSLLQGSQESTGRGDL